MAQKGMWQPIERRIRDAGAEKRMKVRECKPKAEEDSWSGLNQVKDHVRRINL